MEQSGRSSADARLLCWPKSRSKARGSCAFTGRTQTANRRGLVGLGEHASRDQAQTRSAHISAAPDAEGVLDTGLHAATVHRVRGISAGLPTSVLSRACLALAARARRSNQEVDFTGFVAFAGFGLGKGATRATTQGRSRLRKPFESRIVLG